MISLKDMCEEYMIKNMRVDGAALQHAVTHRLDKRVAQCVRVMKADPVQFVDDLLVLASESTLEHMHDLWPLLCDRAGIKVPFDMPSVDHIRAMWPFVSHALRATKKATSLVAKKEKLETIERAVRAWPEALYAHLPRSHSVDSKARDWMIEKVASLFNSPTRR